MSPLAEGNDFPLTALISCGQSLAIGSGGTQPLARALEYPPQLLMPDVGPNSDVRLSLPSEGGQELDAASITGLRHLVTRRSRRSRHCGQTPLETLALTLAGRRREVFNCMAMGVGGTSIIGLGRGTLPYRNLLAAVRKTTELASGYGLRQTVPAIVWRHGEADLRMRDYEPRLVELQADLERDIQEITGQRAGVPFIMAQLSSFAPSVGVWPVIAMLTVHLRHPSRFRLSHPSYQLSHRSDCVHLTTVGYAHDGEYFAKAWRDDWQPLMPARWGRSGNVVDVAFHVPVAPLLIDHDTWPERGGTNAGFDFLTADGRAIRPDDVAVVDGTAVRITLPAPASGILRYAMLGHPGNGRALDLRPRGNLRDSDTTPSVVDGRPLFNWAVHFVIGV